MNSADDLMDPSQLYFEGEFKTQVMDLLRHVRLTASEVRNIRDIFSDVESTLQYIAPGLEVQPFGSIVTGLGIRTSDVDCFIALPYKQAPDISYIIKARNLLRKNYRNFAKVFAITSAKVPIVKFLHVPSNCYCDINFKSPFGVLNSELIGYLLHLDKSDSVLRLAIIVKYWSKVHKFTGTNLMSSYALTMMVIFYLQLMNMLPSVCELQKTVPRNMVDNWNTAFDRRVSVSTKPDFLYDLLGGFFKCYANINFAEHIISPYLGRIVNRQTFNKLEEIPEEFGLYKFNLLNNMCQPLNIKLPICVQDPFELSRNCSSTVHIKLGLRIKAHFEYAARMFDELTPEQFLRAILIEDPNTAPQAAKKKVKLINHNRIVKAKLRSQKRQGNMHIIQPYAVFKNLSKK